MGVCLDWLTFCALVDKLIYVFVEFKCQYGHCMLDLKFIESKEFDGKGFHVHVSGVT